jgi:hypothetical protein
MRMMTICVGDGYYVVGIAAYTALDKININVDTAITCTNQRT